jgi:hypothetical protein
MTLLRLSRRAAKEPAPVDVRVLRAFVLAGARISPPKVVRVPASLAHELVYANKAEFLDAAQARARPTMVGKWEPIAESDRAWMPAYRTPR